jgi:GFO/IDH/MocA oxidoreductase family protein
LEREGVVRIGVVGGGLIAQVAHLPALRALDALFELVGLAEPDAGVREALARRYGIAAYADHLELLEGHDLDALLVCSPNGTHARIALDALDAELHVLVEKPLCLSPRDADEIASRARTRERVVQVGYMKRYDPAYELLLEHAPDDVAFAGTVTLDPGIGERLRPAGFVAPASGAALGADQVAEALGNDDPRHVGPYGNAFLGALIHDANLVLGVLGERDWRVVDAAAPRNGAYGAWTDGRVRWTALWQLARVPAFTEELRLIGETAVELRFPAPYLGAPATLRAGDRCWAPSANAYARGLEHFHACVTRGEPCRTPAEQGARDVALLAELYRKAIA